MKYENTPTIKTQRLTLRKWNANDAQALLELLSDEAVNQFLPWFPIKSPEEAAAFLQERFLTYYDKPSAYRYAICDGQDRPIGYVWLSDNESHDFGYGLIKQEWHKGIVTEAAKAVVEQIKNAGYPYLTATHDVNNPHSGDVMKKLGMTYRYSYVEQWQPKDFPVTFRMYQLDFDNSQRTYGDYWNQSQQHFIESALDGR